MPVKIVIFLFFLTCPLWSSCLLRYFQHNAGGPDSFLTCQSHFCHQLPDIRFRADDQAGSCTKREGRLGPGHRQTVPGLEEEVHGGADVCGDEGSAQHQHRRREFRRRPAVQWRKRRRSACGCLSNCRPPCRGWERFISRGGGSQVSVGFPACP